MESGVVKANDPKDETMMTSTKAARSWATGVLAAGLLLGALAPSNTAFAGTHRTWFVAPGGSAVGCDANSAASPFGAIQAAVGCARGGDVISLAPTGAGAYPGLGRVDVSVTIQAAAGADARSVRVDVSQPGDGAAMPGELVVGSGA